MPDLARPHLAIHGGPAVRTRPMPRRIQVGDAEIAAVERLLRRTAAEGGGFDRYGLGIQARGTGAPDAALGAAETEVVLFERELAAFHGVRFVDAVSSGTAASHALLASLRLEPGDEIVTSPLTDPGVVMAVLLAGGVPVFADHDPGTALMSAASVAAVLSARTRAVVVTHLMGLVVDVPAIEAAVRSAGVPVIADVAQAHAIEIGGSRRTVLGHAGFSSLMATKHITAGGQGGFVATDDEDLHWRVKRFADRGKPFGMPVREDDRFHGGDRVSVGLNYRMAELNAAVGRAQLGRLPEIAARRGDVYRRLATGLEGLATVGVPDTVPGATPNPWAAVFRLRPGSTALSVEAFTDALSAEGIPATPLIPGMVPIADELAFLREIGDRLPPVRHPVVDALAAELFVIWIHEGWADDDVVDTLAAFRKLDVALAR